MIPIYKTSLNNGGILLNIMVGRILKTAVIYEMILNIVMLKTIAHQNDHVGQNQ